MGNSWTTFKAETSQAIDSRVAQPASMALPSHQSGQQNVAQSGPVFTNVNCPTAPLGIDPNVKSDPLSKFDLWSQYNIAGGASGGVP